MLQVMTSLLLLQIVKQQAEQQVSGTGHPFSCPVICSVQLAVQQHSS